VSQFGGSIDEFKVNLFGGSSGDLGYQGLSQHENSLFGSYDTSLDHQEIVSNDTVMRESSQRGDVFVGQISVSGSIVLDSGIGTFTNSVNFFVNFGSMVITQLTGSGDRESYSSGMPGTNTTNFSVTSV
jgi:hypothetical protein